MAIASSRLFLKRAPFQRGTIAVPLFLALSLLLVPRGAAQVTPRAEAPKVSKAPARPKLVVLLVVDQMRGDYVDKFLGQWTGGLKRLVGDFVTEGLGFRLVETDSGAIHCLTPSCSSRSDRKEKKKRRRGLRRLMSET